MGQENAIYLTKIISISGLSSHSVSYYTLEANTHVPWSLTYEYVNKLSLFSANPLRADTSVLKARQSAFLCQDSTVLLLKIMGFEIVHFSMTALVKCILLAMLWNNNTCFMLKCCWWFYLADIRSWRHGFTTTKIGPSAPNREKENKIGSFTRISRHTRRCSMGGCVGTHRENNPPSGESSDVTGRLWGTFVFKHWFRTKKWGESYFLKFIYSVVFARTPHCTVMYVTYDIIHLKTDTSSVFCSYHRDR